MQLSRNYLAQTATWFVVLCATGLFFAGCQKDSGKTTLELSASTLDFESTGGTQTLNITSNAEAWSVNLDNDEWLTVTPTEGAESGTASVTAAAHTGTKPRETTITVSAEGAKPQTVKVTQAAATLDQTWRSLAQTTMNSNPTGSWGGDRYKGQGGAGNRNGLGAYLWGTEPWTGDFYFGEWNNGSISGYGIHLWHDFVGNTFFVNCPGSIIHVGNISNNQKSGMGSCYDKTGARLYYGEFKDDKPVGTYPSAGTPDYSHTFEITKAADGSYYLGESVQGKRNGYGITLYANRDMWYGPWKDGLRDGYGILVSANGTLRVGTWKGDTYTP